MSENVGCPAQGLRWGHPKMTGRLPQTTRHPSSAIALRPKDCLNLTS